MYVLFIRCPISSETSPSTSLLHHIVILSAISIFLPNRLSTLLLILVHSSPIFHIMFTLYSCAALLLAASVVVPGRASPAMMYEYEATHSTTYSSTADASVASGSMPAVNRVVGGDSSQGAFSAPLRKKSKGSAKAKRDVAANPDSFSAPIVGGWLVVLEIGTPGQQLELLLDLGSDSFVVESTLVAEDMQTTQYPIYAPDTSTSAEQLEGYTWIVGYGGLTLEGVVYTDVLTLGANSWNNMTIDVVTGEPTGSPLQ